jgi:hypothetical protein
MTIDQRLAAAAMTYRADAELATLLDEAASRIRELELPDRPRIPKLKKPRVTVNCGLCGAPGMEPGTFCRECSTPCYG